MEDRIISTEVEKLIQTKEYEDLNYEEKKYVLSYITKEEYQEFRLILLTVNESKVKDSLEPNNNDLDILLSAFDKSKDDTIIRKILEFTMPVYKVAAGMILILAASYFVNMKFFPSSHDRIVFLTDTIYKEILVPENIWLADSSIKADYYNSNIISTPSKTIHKKRKNTDPLERKELDETSDINKYARHAGMLTDRDISDFRRKQNGGKNLYEDSILKGFMVVVP